MSTEKLPRPCGDFVILNHALPPVRISFSEAARTAGERTIGDFVVKNHALPPVKVNFSSSSNQDTIRSFAPEGTLTKDHSYDLMNLLTVFPNVDYYATAFVNELFADELAEPSTYQAIYIQPIEFGKRIHRIFVLNTLADLNQLDLKRKDILKQQALAGVDLKFIERKELERFVERMRLPTKIENLACVDRLVAGILQLDGTNHVSKDPREIDEVYGRFHAYSAASDEAGRSIYALLNLAA